MCIPKGVDKEKNLTKNYRPISMLNVLSKVLESFIIRRLRSEILPNISTDQHGIVQGKSTITAISDMRKWIKESKCRHVIGAFIDISGAFDNVKWILILEDLLGIGASNEIIELIKSYLDDRRITLTIEDTTITKKVLRGCPQGSRHGPLLWNVAMDAALRIPHDSNHKIIAYADDVVILVGAARVDTGIEKIKRHYLIIENEKTQIISLKGGRPYSQSRWLRCHSH